MIWPRVWGVLPVRETGAGSTAQRRRSCEGRGVSYSHAQNTGPRVTVLGPQSSSPQQNTVQTEKQERSDLEKTGTSGLSWLFCLNRETAQVAQFWLLKGTDTNEELKLDSQMEKQADQCLGLSQSEVTLPGTTQHR